MFNKKLYLTKIALIIVVSSIINSCNQKVNIAFTEFNIERNENAIVEINAPRAEGTNKISNTINSNIENHIAKILNFAEDESGITLNDAVTKFDSIFISFKDDFEETSLIWEAVIDGEVTYQSPEIICVALNSYLNTGGAHGNMNISFLNLNSQTGEVIQNNDLIKNRKAFVDLAKLHFRIKMQDSINENTLKDYFFGEDFRLPANMGFSDEGVILLYNVYEIATYAQGITEFTIPFEEALPYLNIY
jgi:hypothetical protein